MVFLGGGGEGWGLKFLHYPFFLATLQHLSHQTEVIKVYCRAHPTSCIFSLIPVCGLFMKTLTTWFFISCSSSCCLFRPRTYPSCPVAYILGLQLILLFLLPNLFFQLILLVLQPFLLVLQPIQLVLQPVLFSCSLSCLSWILSCSSCNLTCLSCNQTLFMQTSQVVLLPILLIYTVKSVKIICLRRMDQCTGLASKRIGGFMSCLRLACNLS